MRRRGRAHCFRRSNRGFRVFAAATCELAAVLGLAACSVTEPDWARDTFLQECQRAFWERHVSHVNGLPILEICRRANAARS